MHGRVATGLIALAATGALLVVAAPAAAELTPQQRAAIDQALTEEMNRSGYPGMVAGVWSRDGSYVTAQGVSDLDTGAPISPDQPTRVGSITKTFTATLILQLVDRGRLRLSDRLSEFFPRVPQARRIRIRNLLNHTSGVPDLPSGVSARIFLAPETQWRPGQLIRRSSLQPSECAVGECWHYSNVNYILLGRIAEIATRRSLSALYRRHIFRPLGLDHTTYAPGAVVPPNAVNGYFEPTPGSLVATTNWNYSWTNSAGAMVSTLRDLHRFARALAAGRGLLSKRMQRRRLRFVPLRFTGREFRYGLGIAKFGTFLGHNGEVPGYESMMLSSPERRATVVVYGNTSPALNEFGSGQIPDPDLFGLAAKLRKIVLEPSS